MTTFKQFINEESQFDLEQFKKDCKFAIDLSKSGKSNSAINILYHGTKRYDANFSIENWRWRSAPKDTPYNIHSEVNAYFKSVFGSPIRNWLFTSGRKVVAEGYGRGVAQAIFPIGKFNWVYSPDISDLSVAYETTVEEVKRREEAAGRSLAYSDIQEKSATVFLERIADSTWFKDKNFPQALSSQNEIMIACDKFYQFNTKGRVYREIVKPYLDSL